MNPEKHLEKKRSYFNRNTTSNINISSKPDQSHPNQHKNTYCESKFVQ
eukprot:UN00064